MVSGQSCLVCRSDRAFRARTRSLLSAQSQNTMIPASRLLSLLLFILVVPHPGMGQTTDTSPKCPMCATAYSLAGTAGPIAMGSGLTYAALRWEATAGPAVFLRGQSVQIGAGLIAAGLVAGPAVGHFYSNAKRQAGLGIGIRVCSFLVGGAAASIVLLESFLYAVFKVTLWPLAGEYKLSPVGRVAGYVTVGSGVVLTGSTLFDIVTAPISAYRYNEANDLRARVTPRVSPTLDQVGLAIHLRF